MSPTRKFLYYSKNSQTFKYSKQFFTEQGNQLHVNDINDIITLAKDLKIFPPGRPIVSGIGTLTENISGFIDSILQRLMLFIPS